MSVQDDKKNKFSMTNDGSRPVSPGRRALLRSGMVAMPAILTLQSGAALARSSNLISASAPGTKDSLGRTLCVDKNSVRRAGRGRHREAYDLGERPRAVVNIIQDRDYVMINPDYDGGDGVDQSDLDKEWDFRDQDGDGITRISEGEMCLEGGTYWFKPQGSYRAQSITLPKNGGFVISAGAASSFAHDMTGKLM